ncbi:Crp/Fnr family transcriptional regulator [Haliscomenobacter sp.]|jgi:CRP/FNR family transcriptional regulator, cyclic AMP receptor protein|uniref:Crp/Fnr family transcriptional regulator n=1 Tax=Haliscomenobacter sp. TaxID=2717303 RepID=UPI003BAA7397
MSNEASFWYLENIDVTGIFCPQKIRRGDLEAHFHRCYKRGEYIYLPDEMSDRVFFLTDGRVKIGTYGDSGKEITKAILGKGDVFGELSLVGEDKRRDFAYTMEEATVCVVNVDEMKLLMRDHNALGLFIMKIMGSRVLEMEKRLESLVFKDSRTRIIEYLLESAEKNGRRVGFETEVRKFITHQEIANLTATSRQTVTTLLNDLRDRNILTFDRRRLLIRDMEKLKGEALQVS